jgi:large subunit ribosomal protein L7/L12
MPWFKSLLSQPRNLHRYVKVVRSLTSLGLKEAKDAVTNLPFAILEGKSKAECEEAMKTLEEGGAKSEMK